jgi:hypothetical protein
MELRGVENIRCLAEHQVGCRGDVRGQGGILGETDAVGPASVDNVERNAADQDFQAKISQ